MTILKKYYDVDGTYKGINIMTFDLFQLSFSWFTNCGNWFVYVFFRNGWRRFSNCGYIKCTHSEVPAKGRFIGEEM